ncbi:MAG: hypothetical protein ACI97H_001182, partial [Marinobacter psychrophilus]
FYLKISKLPLFEDNYASFFSFFNLMLLSHFSLWLQ